MRCKKYFRRLVRDHNRGFNKQDLENGWNKLTCSFFMSETMSLRRLHTRTQGVRCFRFSKAFFRQRPRSFLSRKFHCPTNSIDEMRSVEQWFTKWFCSRFLVGVLQNCELFTLKSNWGSPNKLNNQKVNNSLNVCAGFDKKSNCSWHIYKSHNLFWKR